MISFIGTFWYNFLRTPFGSPCSRTKKMYDNRMLKLSDCLCCLVDCGVTVGHWIAAGPVQNVLRTFLSDAVSQSTLLPL